MLPSSWVLKMETVHSPKRWIKIVLHGVKFQKTSITAEFIEGEIILQASHHCTLIQIFLLMKFVVAYKFKKSLCTLSVCLNNVNVCIYLYSLIYI
jgi:hypothetical protein